MWDTLLQVEFFSSPCRSKSSRHKVFGSSVFLAQSPHSFENIYELIYPKLLSMILPHVLLFYF